ncbi:MAG: head GIN domain-containing protein [Erythrobacter sp.]|nr:head GIN domain-containing protein [Erythrobacter sp.]MDZ4275686.1 head GIN domain-containing protein [Erythrobacter sp.]
MIQPLIKSSAPLAVLAFAAALAGCDGADVSINGKKGVPLAEVEIAGPPPSELVLSSGDTVILTEGDVFALKVEGQDTDSLRFVRDSEVIGITRTDGWSGNQTATIRITMPPPSEVVIAGSGTVQAQSLASTAEISIGGSGTVTFASVAADKLDVNIGGSGTVKGAGTAKRLAINIGGSGDVELAGLKADRAEVSIGGAGDVAFASDGEVEANIAGSGDVTVAGSAKCTVNAFGSGTLTCASQSTAAASVPAAGAVPVAPIAPTTPIAPKPAE